LEKKDTIKTIALVVIFIIFIVMFYITFFKGKKNGVKPAPKKLITQESINISKETNAPSLGMNTSIFSSSENSQIFKNITMPFEYFIKDIFTPSDMVKNTLKKKPVSDNPKRVAKARKPSTLTEQEQNQIQQTLKFQGSILSNKNTVAIINGQFIHEGDRIDKYKVISISEKQVDIDTGRGIITLEIMKHE